MFLTPVRQSSVWKLPTLRLQTRTNLQRRGISVDLACPVCGRETETEDHVFRRCSIANNILQDIENWWCVSGPANHSAVDIISWGLELGFKDVRLEVFNAVAFTFFWVIWRWRNSKVFSSPSATDVDIIGAVQSWSFFWINSRGRKKLSWSNWILNPVMESQL